MVAVVLTQPDLALLTDLAGTRVGIPHCVAAPRSAQLPVTPVTFVGDELPTPFRGTDRPLSWQLTCRYAHYEHAQLLALVRLLDRAADEADGRLQWRSHFHPLGGLDGVHAVVAGSYDLSPQAGQIAELTFPIVAVAHTPGV